MKKALIVALVLLVPGTAVAQRALVSDRDVGMTPQATVRLWVGAGVGYLNRSAILRQTRSEVVGNLLVGAGFGDRGVRPYVQAKAILGEESHFSLVFGVRF